ncbi:MAG: ABC transporter ATP-binding protein [Burkholderiaceae bacterium]
MPSLLEVRSATVAFGAARSSSHKLALNQVSLALPAEPCITAVVGESGSGKTTLTRLMLGLLAPTQGDVLYDGQALQFLDQAAFLRYRREVQAVFQDPFSVYNPFYKVDRALLLPLMRFRLVATLDEAYARIHQCLEGVGLRPGDTLGRYPHQLSGGQRQRVMIARALSLRPRVIVADEPVSMVDASLRATILESLYRLKLELKVSLLYVTHDLTTAYQIADHIVVMLAGEIVEQGAPERVIHAPEHAYTRALVAAVPPPDPLIDWGLESEALAA